MKKVKVENTRQQCPESKMMNYKAYAGIANTHAVIAIVFAWQRNASLAWCRRTTDTKDQKMTKTTKNGCVNCMTATDTEWRWPCNMHILVADSHAVMFMLCVCPRMTLITSRMYACA